MDASVCFCGTPLVVARQTRQCQSSRVCARSAGTAPRMQLTEVPPPANRKRGRPKKRPFGYVEPDRVRTGIAEVGPVERPVTERYLVVPDSEFSFRDRDPLDQMGLPDKSYASAVWTQNVNHNMLWQTQLFAERQQAVLLMVHGFHTSGKSEVVHKLSSGFEPGGFASHAWKEPSVRESDYNFLWRYHRRVPRKGHVALWVRSWYEDVATAVLQDQVSAHEADNRMYQIMELEHMLSLQGIKVVKLYLQISDVVAFQRLEETTVVPRGMWRVSRRDFEDKARFNEYMKRWEHVIRTTSMDAAPWYIVPSSIKWVRNTVASQILRDTFSSMNPQIPPEKIASLLQTQLEPQRDTLTFQTM
ncbi:hypothetical protein FVE85_4316 [Porphyridium purpureum]|uniref:Polyphosphate kinase-2-related domain-containing protein n=1 Tax=Porphyridium purpureum TaxID=35688 RepID=A0A5J4YS62_PORPP|nr:hypothetical protein FVE85_4316 [Porphyridium purpureum]|eukprot:POR0139..scf229_5